MFGSLEFSHKSYYKYLVFGDLHYPFAHPDVHAFLSDILSLHPDITHALCDGDLADFHALGRWETNPDLFSPSKELEQARADIAALEGLIGDRPFYVSAGNHCVRLAKKAFGAGIPSECIKSLGEILDTRAEFYDEVVIKRKDEANIVMIHHGSNALETTALGRGYCVIAGHLHTQSYIRYGSTPDHLLWSLQMPCLINKHSPAFAYSKHAVKRPIIGAAIIEHGKPYLIHMPLNSKGRYVSSKLVA